MTHVRTLLPEGAFAGVVETVMDNNPGMEEPVAVRIVDEALKFVATAAAFPTVPVQPSRVVDEGWHALILHTRLYADLCQVLGRFVHHYPQRPDSSRHNPRVLTRTATLLGLAGHAVDPDLWTAPTEAPVRVAANCSHTPVPGGCGPIGPTPRPK